ncbi:release factor glutamine methyltransferase [Bacteroidia bacterium]|nr:release factor glutamine methyltransferase [Bacteroidia bacterium]
MSFFEEQLAGLYTASEIKSLTYLILEEVCHKDKATLLREKREIQQMLDELKKSRPIQYIIGKTEFYNLPFCVNENVLIPRPETEELVERVIQTLAGRKSQFNIWDIGTGSGCIAVALAKNLPNAKVYASDISEKALETAQQNALNNQVEVQFFRQDILFAHSDFLAETFSLIVSNPPYIVPSEKPAMSANVLAYEPAEALFVPEDKPLLFYERIAETGLNRLEQGGYLFFETNARFGKAVAGMLKGKGYAEVEVFQDISGNDRIVKAVKK